MRIGTKTLNVIFITADEEKILQQAEEILTTIGNALPENNDDVYYLDIFGDESWIDASDVLEGASVCHQIIQASEIEG